MSYGTSISADLPEVLSAEPAAAQALREWCDEVEARLETKVTPAGFNVNADLDLLSSYGANNAQHLQLAAASTTKTGASHAGKLYRYLGELYYTNSSGTTVRLTNAGALDVASIRGILGDYSADGNCQVDYTTSSTLYRMLSNLSNLARATVEVGALRVYGTGNNPTYRATVAVPTLAASYNFTLPTNVPGSTSLLEWTSAGQLQSQRSPTLAAVTLDSGGHVTLAGSGEYKHGNKTLSISPAAGYFSSSDFSFFGAYILAAGASLEVRVPIPVREGWRIRTVSVDYRGGGASPPTFGLYKGGTGSTSLQGSTWGTASSGVTLDEVSGTIDTTVATGSAYYVLLTSGNTNDRFGRIAVTYDIP